MYTHIIHLARDIQPHARLSINKLQPMTTHNDIPCTHNPFKHATRMDNRCDV